ncbi:AraC family transcriptional regulator [Frigoribacterium sp. 2-23]|uniref:AraC family transcriptional regulator n=1 Tax=Frigoribacterium sp. 2-23 TaxID=3415006 RepID=UPI003C703130
MLPMTETDALSDVLEQVQVRGLVTGGFAARGPWVSRGSVRHPLKLVALVAGSATVTVDGPGGAQGPIALAPGDVALLNHRTRLEVQSGSGEGEPTEYLPDSSFDSMAVATADRAVDDVLVGGWIEVDPSAMELLRAALPGVVHVRAARPSASPLGDLVERLFDEAMSGRPGSAFALRQHGQLLLLEVLRAHLEQERPPVGWLRLLADDELAPALHLIHGRPGEAWGLVDLARASGMSRTRFAERFRSVAGMPPLTYLSRWRMLLAQRALRDPQVRVGELATRLGYGSDSAFSTAFKRELGESPLQYRLRSRSAS